MPKIPPSEVNIVPPGHIRPVRTTRKPVSDTVVMKPTETVNKGGHRIGNKSICSRLKEKVLITRGELMFIYLSFALLWFIKIFE